MSREDTPSAIEKATVVNTTTFSRLAKGKISVGYSGSQLI
jgi:hypothetical protein